MSEQAKCRVLIEHAGEQRWCEYTILRTPKSDEGWDHRDIQLMDWRHGDQSCDCRRAIMFHGWAEDDERRKCGEGEYRALRLEIDGSVYSEDDLRE